MHAPVSPVGSTDRNRYLQLLGQLEKNRSSWDSHWRELSDYILPRRSRWHTTDRSKAGSKQNSKIVDTTATQAARTLAAGMMSGVTSPSRPWFRLTVPDMQMREVHSVKIWLEEVERVMRETFIKSNLYTTLPICYADLGVFGTHCMMHLEDDQDTIRFHALPVGSYYLASSSKQRIDTLVRKYSMTARQIVQEFGEENVSESVKSAVTNGSGEAWYDVCHVVCPNDGYKQGSIGPRGKRFKSDYFELGSNPDDNMFLRRSGFDTFPALCPRWSTNGEDSYGESPAMDALGDIRGLQMLQRKKAKAIDKIIDPPMKGPGSLRAQGVSLIPGDINYIDGPSEGLTPVHEVRLSLNEIVSDVQEHQGRIRSSLYQDLFMMLQQTDRRDITATEIQAREQERMLQLGPVLERLSEELLDPLIERTFEIMWKRGLVPEPPPEIEGESLKIEYISIMAQAQRMLGITAVDRAMGFIGNLAAVDPGSIDKVDTDHAIEEYFEMLGVPQGLLRTDEDVAAIREARAQAAAAAEQAEQAANQAQAAKVLSETDTRSPSALNDIAQAQGMRR